MQFGEVYPLQRHFFGVKPFIQRGDPYLVQTMLSKEETLSSIETFYPVYRLLRSEETLF